MVWLIKKVVYLPPKLVIVRHFCRIDARESGVNPELYLQL